MNHKELCIIRNTTVSLPPPFSFYGSVLLAQACDWILSSSTHFESQNTQHTLQNSVHKSSETRDVSPLFWDTAIPLVLLNFNHSSRDLWLVISGRDMRASMDAGGLKTGTCMSDTHMHKVNQLQMEEFWCGHLPSMRSPCIFLCADSVPYGLLRRVR